MCFFSSSLFLKSLFYLTKCLELISGLSWAVEEVCLLSCMIPFIRLYIVIHLFNFIRHIPPHSKFYSGIMVQGITLDWNMQLLSFTCPQNDYHYPSTSGVVLMLIIIVIFCCVKARRKKSMQVKGKGFICLFVCCWGFFQLPGSHNLCSK